MNALAQLQDSFLSSFPADFQSKKPQSKGQGCSESRVRVPKALSMAMGCVLLYLVESRGTQYIQVRIPHIHIHIHIPYSLIVPASPLTTPT